MASYTKKKLSGSTDGLGILVAATGTQGTLLHTCVTGTNDYDEVWVWAVNSKSTAVELTVEVTDSGNTVTAPRETIPVTIPSKSGLYKLLPGLVFHNDTEIRAFAVDNANLVVCFGFANLITA